MFLTVKLLHHARVFSPSNVHVLHRYCRPYSIQTNHGKVMGEEEELRQTWIFKYNNKGFRINDRFIYGPCVLFPKHTLLWNVRSVDDITTEACRIFTLTTPKPEIVVLGLGDANVKLKPEIYNYFKEYDIRLETADTRIACQQFNHLSEGMWRQVAAGLIPPKNVDVHREKELQERAEAKERIDRARRGRET
eukprot:CFRG0380T1